LGAQTRFPNTQQLFLSSSDLKTQTCTSKNICFKTKHIFPQKMSEVRIIKTLKRQENTEIPPVALIGGRLKIKIMFCSERVVPNTTEVNEILT